MALLGPEACPGQADTTALRSEISFRLAGLPRQGEDRLGRKVDLHLPALRLEGPDSLAVQFASGFIKVPVRWPGAGLRHIDPKAARTAFLHSYDHERIR